MTNRFGKMAMLTAAAAVAFVALGGTAKAATAPVSDPRILAHFDLAAGQTPENIALDDDGSADLTFALARQVAHVTADGATSIRATLPAVAHPATPIVTSAAGAHAPVFSPEGRYVTSPRPRGVLALFRLAERGQLFEPRPEPGRDGAPPER